MKTGRLMWLGLSRDLRTNRWLVTCPVCAKDFEPLTTMFATDSLVCPSRKCQANIFVNYNELVVRAIE